METEVGEEWRVQNSRRQKQKQREERRQQQERTDRGHMSADEAKRLRSDLNIWNLDRALLSLESRTLQDQGYRFDRVIKGDNMLELNVGEQFIEIEGNQWGDVAVFVKK